MATYPPPGHKCIFGQKCTPAHTQVILVLVGIVVVLAVIVGVAVKLIRGRRQAKISGQASV